MSGLQYVLQGVYTDSTSLNQRRSDSASNKAWIRSLFYLNFIYDGLSGNRLWSEQLIKYTNLFDIFAIGIDDPPPEQYVIVRSGTGSRLDAILAVRAKSAGMGYFYLYYLRSFSGLFRQLWVFLRSAPGQIEYILSQKQHKLNQGRNNLSQG